MLNIHFREMAKAGLAKKLQEEDLDEKEAVIFERFMKSIVKEVGQLKVILQGLEAKEKERAWLKHQSSGDLDEAKVCPTLLLSSPIKCF